jgi:Cu-Zn family superoxide dismutase
MKKSTAMLLALLSVPAYAETVVTLNVVDEKGVGAEIGKVTIADSRYGLVFTPALQGLPPGLHGFHVHQNPSCQPGEKDGKTIAAGAAGGHYDPAGTNRHGEPWGDGHLGDLPPLYVDANGSATQPVLAPRLKAADVAGHSIMVHAGGDNHADHPAPLGGGGARVACGVVPAGK